MPLLSALGAADADRICVWEHVSMYMCEREDEEKREWEGRGERE